MGNGNVLADMAERARKSPQSNGNTSESSIIVPLALPHVTKGGSWGEVDKTASIAKIEVSKLGDACCQRG